MRKPSRRFVAERVFEADGLWYSPGSEIDPRAPFLDRMQGVGAVRELPAEDKPEPVDKEE